MINNKQYILFLLTYIDFLLQHLKNKKIKKILAFYKPKLINYTDTIFTEPLITHYIMQGLFLVHKQK